MASTTATDRIAMLTSSLCIAHCLALPAIAVVLPLVGSLADNELVHFVFAMVAIAASASIPLRSPDARKAAFLVPATFGNTLLIAGLFADVLTLDEIVVTVIGGAILAVVHANRLRSQHE